MIDIILPTFATLFVIIDPIGLMPIFLALTADGTPAEKRRIALRACLLAAVLLGGFGLAGEEILGALGIGFPAFRIAGGLLLLLTAIEMLFEKRTTRRQETARRAGEEEAASPGDTPRLDPGLAVFPIAMPLLAGPGSMASMVLLIGEHTGDTAAQAAVYGVMLFVLGIAFALFSLASVAGRLLGPTAINVLTRLFGMLLAALSVQFILDGLANYGLIPAG